MVRRSVGKVRFNTVLVLLCEIQFCIVQVQLLTALSVHSRVTVKLSRVL